MSADAYCNNCRSPIDFPERGIISFDGRYCGQECKDAFILKLIKRNMGKLENRQREEAERGE